MKFAMTALAAVSVATLGCSPTPQAGGNTDQGNLPAAGASPSAQVSDAGGLYNRTWTLVRLGTSVDPRGAGGRPVTLRIETDPDAIAGGNAGCNRYTGPYTVRGDSISFGPSISTKMACMEGMDVEQSYLTMLPGVERYAVADSTLTLLGRGGPLAEFRARADSV